MEKYYRFAGAEVCVRIPDRWAYRDERQLAPFAASTVQDPWIFDGSPASRLPSPQGRRSYTSADLEVWEQDGLRQIYRGCGSGGWEKATLYTASRGKQHRILWKDSIYPGPIGIKTILECLNASHLINRAGGCILHCSYIEHQGKAIVFTAPSGVGKSTQAELWRCHRGARILNGDRAAVRMVDGVPMAEAIPFAGSSEYCLNRDLPLAAIVYLGQSPETTLRPLTGAAAFRRVWEGCTVNIWDKEDLANASQTIAELIQAVPVCRLECLPDQSAVTALEEFLKGR